MALVPGPRLHLIHFHGELAPNAKLRAQVVPQEPEAPAQEAKPAECEPVCAHHRPVRLSWAKLLKRLASARASVPWQPVIEKILTHLGLQARAPPRAPVSGQVLQAA